MNNRKTVIIGASPNPSRYSFLAAQRLAGAGEAFVPLGIKSGELEGNPILDIRKRPVIEDVDTITLYISEKNISEYEEYILSLNPRRIIFNPGTGNPGLMEKAKNAGIETLVACTLAMLATRSY